MFFLKNIAKYCNYWIIICKRPAPPDKGGREEEEEGEGEEILADGPTGGSIKVVQEVLADLKRNNFAAQLTRREAI